MRYPNVEPEFVYGEYQNITVIGGENRRLKSVFLLKYYEYVFKTKVTLADGEIIERPMIEANEETGEIAWDKTKHIATVKKVLSYPQVNIVKRRVEEQTVGQNGGLFDNNMVSLQC